MQYGQVKWFNNSKGFGFTPNDSDEDLFVHHTEIKIPGVNTLNEGEKVKFEIKRGSKGPEAANVTRAND